TANGQNSKVGLNGLTSYQGTGLNGYLWGLTSTAGGTIQAPSLTTLHQAAVSVDGSGTLSSDQMQSLTGGTLSVSGGSTSFKALANLDGSSVSVSGGAQVSLPALKGYDGQATYDPRLRVDGGGSVLDLSLLQSLKGSTGYDFVSGVH